jgi:hypothetical protein
MEKFRIRETVSCFRVEKLCPKIKTKKNLFGWPVSCYEDYSDMIWLQLDSNGNPIDLPKSDILFLYTPWPETFRTFEQAKAFIEKVKKEKIIVEI